MGHLRRRTHLPADVILKDLEEKVGRGRVAKTVAGGFRCGSLCNKSVFALVATLTELRRT